MNEYIFFLTSENKHTNITIVNSQYLCKYPKCLGYWSCLLSISYNIQKKKKKKKKKKNAGKISDCHFETIGHTLYNRAKTRRCALFVKWTYIMWAII